MVVMMAMVMAMAMAMAMATVVDYRLINNTSFFGAFLV
jgi:hypothetical protein